jgi:acetyltransferase-like isoleucine patch superfamily enzyme
MEEKIEKAKELFIARSGNNALVRAMLSGAEFDPAVLELNTFRITKKCAALNLDPNYPRGEWGKTPFQSFIPELGNGLIEPDFWAEFPFIIAGDGFYFGPGTKIAGGGIYIGNNVNIGPDCTLATMFHNPSADPVKRRHVRCSPIVLKDGVLIYAKSMINPGVTIGENSIIRSGSLVTKDIPPNVVASGSPAKVLMPLADYITKYNTKYNDRFR